MDRLRFYHIYPSRWRARISADEYTYCIQIRGAACECYAEKERCGLTGSICTTFGLKFSGFSPAALSFRHTTSHTGKNGAYVAAITRGQLCKKHDTREICKPVTSRRKHVPELGHWGQRTRGCEAVKGGSEKKVWWPVLVIPWVVFIDQYGIIMVWATTGGLGKGDLCGEKARGGPEKRNFE
ncbi:hypothetical protein EDB83DRAFT_2315313 [Lactarius deliciosus]|nr:hypothetical protein EDB83DRAFT_2315313 [Lactarius deliciosus]